MKQQLTEWFPADVKPVHVGWYHTDKGIDESESDFNWWWDGGKWLTGPLLAASNFQNRKWRGLAEKPN